MKINSCNTILSLNYSDFLSNVGMCISCGYMIYDSLTMIMYLKGASLFTFLIHHFIVIWGTSAFLCNEIGKYYAYLKFLTELSTPFINARWCLRVSGYPSNHKYVALSTCIFAVTFIITRNICAVPFWYFVLYDMHHHTTEAQRIFLTNVFKRYFILGVGLDILNLFWGVIICSMLWRSIKVLRNLMNKKSE
ncbi:Transmembrane protein 56 [Schistosoma japonicum]|nr:Transmembrane protein 56 [Schistosoma japonicum]